MRVQSTLLIGFIFYLYDLPSKILNPYMQNSVDVNPTTGTEVLTPSPSIGKMDFSSYVYVIWAQRKLSF